jgi:hypothetical protein
MSRPPIAIPTNDRVTACEVYESRLRYGCCEVLNWEAFSDGPFRDTLWAQHRLIASEVIRVHVFDRGTPDPLKEWPKFARYIQAVLNSGAVPMITFARSKAPFDSTHNRRWFANRCGEVAWNCLQHWGDDAVRKWYWCLWTKPNSQWDNPGMTFESYRGIYEEAAGKIVASFRDAACRDKPLIGGPSIDGFQPFWFDWIWRFVEEVDPGLIGFVSWQRYGDWRAPGEWRSAPNAAAFDSLVMSRTPEYRVMAGALQRMLRGRGVLNVCSELNAHAHYSAEVSARLNHGAFGAAYYAASLLQLIRGGADLELRWSGSDAAGTAFGLMDSAGRPNHVFFAKMLFVHFVRRGSTVCLSLSGQGGKWLDAASVENADGSAAVLLINKHRKRTVVSLEECGLRVSKDASVLKLDASAQARIVSTPIDQIVEFDGYGVAVATERVPATLVAHVTDAAGQLA